MANMVTLLPIEPLDEAHGMLIVEAFNELFINSGGQSDGYGNGYGNADGYGCGYSGGRGYDNDYGNGDGNGDGDGKPPEEWSVE